MRKFLGERQFKTSSDAGGVKVGTDGFSMIIPNGYGDGITRVAIVGKNELPQSDILRFFTSVKGEKINIYSYDCGEGVSRTMSGRYGIFHGEGFVVFEKWED